MSNWKIPLFEPEFTSEDIEAACAPLREGWISMGERTYAFEKAFRDKICAAHVFAVCNGTAALHLALAALGIGRGDEVILPSLTFVACANVIVQQCAIPVFTDCCSEEDWTLSPQDIERKITHGARAIMAVHYAGFPCRMEEIVPIARRHNLAIIEDCAHALFSIRKGKPCGLWGDIGCFSFFTNKNMTTGEGGMLTTNDDRLAERIRLMRSHGMTTLTLDRHRGYARSYDVVEFGFNYRIDEIRAALGSSQLQRMDSRLLRRKEIYWHYLEKLKDIDGIIIPFQDRTEDNVGYHIFPIYIKKSSIRDQLMDALKQEGIQTSIHYPPIHHFMAYREAGYSAECPLTERLTSGEITLPFYPSMSEEQISIVCESLRRNLLALS
ncbi:MAG: DegT/DnrJ/EryC1/StrS family aminotransferase [Candidatus Omnitrophota bacterium]